MSVDDILSKAKELEEGGDLIGARRLWDSVVGLDRSSRNLVGYARVLLESGEFDRAEALAREAIAGDPSDAAGYFCLGAILDTGGERQAAIDAIQQGLSITDSIAFRLVLANIYDGLNNKDEARRAFESVLAEAPSNVEALQGLARSVRRTDPPRAVHLLRRLVDLVPNSSGAHRELGIALWLSGQLAAAEAALRAAIELAPDDAWAHDYLYSVLRTSHRPVEAEHAIRAALALRPDIPLFHSELGDALATQSKWDEAEKAYRQSLGIDVADFNANLYFARYLERRGQLAKAEKYYRRAQSSNPASSEAMVALERLRCSTDGDQSLPSAPAGESDA